MNPETKGAVPADSGSFGTPRTNHYLIRLREGAERTPGGIYLPDNWRDNWNDGVVAAQGPGLPIPGADERLSTPMWAEVGDVVLFQRHDYRALPGDGKWGIVGDDNLVGVIPGGVGAFEPLNDWVQIRQDPARTREGALLLAEEYYPKPMSGIVLAFGPGQRRTRGDYYGTRRSVGDILGRDDRQILGQRVYWTKECEALACGRDALEFLLIRADDLWGMEIAAD